MLYYADDKVEITNEEAHIGTNSYPIPDTQWAAIATTDAEGQAATKRKLWTSMAGIILLTFALFL